ncbi:DUF6444 domain-containing protein [Paludisphaera soli]|uniref:DUF6444 domain-containing protein n=1 Tax=Paludisphaera soli TaxID=2712865 RepID=UPI0036F41276
MAQAALDAVVAAFEARIASQDARIAELKARLNRSSSNSSRPSSSDPLHPRPALPCKPSGRQRGGGPGPRRHDRIQLDPDEVVHVKGFHPTLQVRLMRRS